METVNVWSVCVGDKYSDADVIQLQRQVEANIERPHKFYCLSDRERDLPGAVVMRLASDQARDFPGWWAKLLLFRLTWGQVLYLDLDVIIVDALDGLLSDRLAMPKNWAQSGHGGGQSSVMSWHNDFENGLHAAFNGAPGYGWIVDEFNPELVGEPAGGNHGRYGPLELWGDQEFITHVAGPPGEHVFAMDGVYSYKYHCRPTGHPPADAVVIAFHGHPKPNEVNDEWVRSAIQSTRTQD